MSQIWITIDDRVLDNPDFNGNHWKAFAVIQDHNGPVEGIEKVIAKRLYWSIEKTEKVLHQLVKWRHEIDGTNAVLAYREQQKL
jgi:hypothetical protein